MTTWTVFESTKFLLGRGCETPGEIGWQRFPFPGPYIWTYLAMLPAY